MVEFLQIKRQFSPEHLNRIYIIFTVCISVADVPSGTLKFYYMYAKIFQYDSLIHLFALKYCHYSILNGNGSGDIFRNHNIRKQKTLMFNGNCH